MKLKTILLTLLCSLSVLGSEDLFCGKEVVRKRYKIIYKSVEKERSFKIVYNQKFGPEDSLFKALRALSEVKSGIKVTLKPATHKDIVVFNLFFNTKKPTRPLPSVGGYPVRQAKDVKVDKHGLVEKLSEIEGIKVFCGEKKVSFGPNETHSAGFSR